MVRNKELTWKEIVGRGAIYIIGIPIAFALCIVGGFMIIGLIWVVLNTPLAILDWVVDGTISEKYFLWTMSWTRVSILTGIVLAIIVFFNLVEESGDGNLF